MKKRFFVALGAISIVVAGMLVVACTPDVANSPDVQVNEVVQRAPAVSEQASEDAWADFNAQVEALTEKYRNQRMGSNLGYTDDLTTFHKLIVYADVAGAQTGWEDASNQRPVVPNDVIGMATIASVYRSYIPYNGRPDTTTNDTTGINITIVIRDTMNILDLTPVNSPYVIVGKRHNQLMTNLINGNYNSTGKSPYQIFQDFIHAYEQLHAPLTNSYKQAALSRALYARESVLNNNIKAANETYKTNVAQMTLSNMRSYTIEYLQIVDASSLNVNDKNQISLFAAVAYYSSALWIVQ